MPTNRDVLYLKIDSVSVLNEIQVNGKAWILMDSELDAVKIQQFDLVVFLVALTDYRSKFSSSIARFNDLFRFDGQERAPPIILMFNKKDIFYKQISIMPLDDVFPEYEGGVDPRAARIFIRNLFISKVKAKRNTLIFPIFSTAIDVSNVRQFTSVVNNSIVRKFLITLFTTY